MLHASRCSYSKLSHEASYCFMHICLSPLLCVHKSRVLLNVQEAMDSHILEWEGLQRAAEEDESATRRLMTQQSDLKTKIASTRCAPAAFCHDRIGSLSSSVLHIAALDQTAELLLQVGSNAAYLARTGAYGVLQAGIMMAFG